MDLIEQQLNNMGWQLPPPITPPPGIKLPFSMIRVLGNRALISGHGPQGPAGELDMYCGRIGDQLDIEAGYRAAQLTALSVLGSLKRELGSLDRVTRWGRIFGMVAATPGFAQHPNIINGFSDLIIQLYGHERGQHSRSAVGVAELPFGIPVEIEGEVKIAIDLTHAPRQEEQDQ